MQNDEPGRREPSLMRPQTLDDARATLKTSACRGTHRRLRAGPAELSTRRSLAAGVGFAPNVIRVWSISRGRRRVAKPRSRTRPL